jgi:hypothetical protein
LIRTFVYALLFEQALKNLKHSSEILERVESAILENPETGDVIQGTGGVRKMRLEDSAKARGKRGGFRILFLDLPHVERTHLLFLYGKNEADNISPEGKKLIKQLVNEIKTGGRK